MTSNAIMKRLGLAGISATVRGDQLVLRPRTAVTDAIAREVREHKSELMALLTSWDEQHARNAIAATLRRIESQFPQDAALGTTWHDDTLANLEERVNTAAQAKDRPEFDTALLVDRNG